MDTVHLNHRIFKTAASAVANLASAHQVEPDTSTSSSYPIPYTEIMLCEYYHLVNSLKKLDDSQLQGIQAEVNKVLSKLTKWLDKTGSINAIELFSAMRHLKQKANGLTKQITQKSSIINNKTNKFMNDVSYIISLDSYAVDTQ